MRKKIIFKISTVVTMMAIISAITLPAYAASTTSTGTATIGFTAGTLSILSVPSFNFGTTNVIQATATPYTATAVTGKIAIADNRGSEAGWKLGVKLGVFANSTYPTLTPLAGATLALPIPAVTAETGTVGTAPTGAIATLTASEASDHTVLSAAAAIGGGAWDGAYTAANVTLNVPGGTALSGTNTANLTWTLYDAP